MGFFSKFASSFVKERVSNTKTALELIVEDFKRYVLIMKYIFLVFSLGSVIYNIVTNTGNLIINCVLIGVLVVYSILDTIFRQFQNPDPSKKLRIIYAWVKIALNAAALVSSVYTLYSATAGDAIKPISIVLTTLSLLMFILKVILEIVLDVISSKWKLLKGAMIMDAQEYPSTSGKIFFPFVGDVEEVDVKDSIKKRIRERQDKWKIKF